MAAPGEKTVHNLSGKWKLNHALSTNLDAAMALQGVNFIMRAAIQRAPISLTIKHTRDSATGVEELLTRQSTSWLALEEERALDWEGAPTSHVIFGDIETKARISALYEFTNLLLSTGWISWQAWGFEVIDGKRYHVRRAVLQKETESRELADEPLVVRSVYDWVEY